VDVRCPSCGASHEFPQPYPYHAGFGDTAFLYNEAGDRTLTWGTYDAAYLALLGAGGDPWCPPPATRAQLEARLPPSPSGDRWGFAFPARCTRCRAALRAPMVEGEGYYLEWRGSVILGRAGLPSKLDDYLAS
jgi:hypothetical protein